MLCALCTQEAFIGEGDKFEMLRQEKEVRQRRSNAPLDQQDLDAGEAYWANDLEANDQERQKSFRSTILSFCRSLKYMKVCLTVLRAPPSHSHLRVCC